MSRLERRRKQTWRHRSGSVSQVVASARSRRASQWYPGRKTTSPLCRGSGLSAHDSTAPKLKSFVTGRDGGEVEELGRGPGGGCHPAAGGVRGSVEPIAVEHVSLEPEHVRVRAVEQ